MIITGDYGTIFECEEGAQGPMPVLVTTKEGGLEVPTTDLAMFYLGICERFNEEPVKVNSRASKYIKLAVEAGCEHLRTEKERLQTVIDNRAEDREVLAKYKKLHAEIASLKAEKGMADMGFVPAGAVKEIERLQTVNERLNDGINMALLELDHILAEKTPTEKRIEKILREQKKGGE